MYVHPVERIDELRTLKDAWNRLAGGIPFRRWEWLGNWWRHFGGASAAGPGRRRLLVLLVYESAARQQLLGVAPWFVDRKRIKGRTIRFLGSGEVCSDHLSILCEPGYEQPLAAVLAAWLHEHEAGTWDSIELSSFVAGDVVTTELVEHLRQAGHASLTWTDCRCWRIALPRSWDDFQSRLSKSHRKQLRRIQRRLFDTGRARLQTAKSADEAAAAFQTLVDLHQRRRWSLDESGCFESARFAAFLSDATGELFEAGVLRLNSVELDGQVVAADYNLLADGVLYAYQGGIDPDQLETGPGQLLTLATLRQAIDDGLDRYDLLRGDEAYKLHWRAEPWPLSTARVFGLSRAARVRRFLWLARRSLYQFSKKVLRRGPWRSATAPDQKIRTDVPQTPLRPVPAPAGGGLAVRAINTPAQIAELRSAWNRLSGGIVFRQFEWLESWWNHFGKTQHGRRQLLIATVADEAGNIIGLAPWYVERSLAHGSVVRFLGDGIACSDYLSILHHEGQQERVAAALAGWLTGPRRPAWQRLELTGVEAGDLMMSALAGQFRQRGFAVYASPGANCWQTPLTNWDDCLAALPKSMRTKVRRCQKRYFDTGRARFCVATSAEELAAGFEIFAALHQKRRTSAGDPGCFSDPAFAAFLREMAERFLACGQLELSRIELDGRPIAASLNLLGNRTSYFYQSGIEPDALEYSPGHMMHMACVKQAIARGDVAYDFLRGDEPYKKLWAAQPVPAVEYRIIANQFSAVVRHRAWLESRRARRTAKRGLAKVRRWQQTSLAACKFGGTGA